VIALRLRQAAAETAAYFENERSVSARIRSNPNAAEAPKPINTALHGGSC
jgi:hypothetical protein